MSQSIVSSTISYEDMLKSGMHFGRRRSVFNPQMNKYVFTVRNGICIIDLIKTKSELEKAATALQEIIDKNGLILFVGITKQSAESMKALAESFGMPYVINRWLGGTLTNFKVISGRVKMLEEMEKKLASGVLDRYTKKEKLMFERQLQKMKVSFDGLRKLTRLPDIIFVSSLNEGALPVREARRMKLKVVAIANTDSNPSGADFIVPANDRSKKSVDLILDSLRSDLKKSS